MQEKDFLEAFRRSARPVTGYVAEHGRFYPGQPLPKRYRVKPAMQCYANARDLVVRSKGKLRYCEGFAHDPTIRGWLFDHAWALDAEDRVIDPTLQDRQGNSIAGHCFYYGVVIQLAPGEPLFDHGTPLYRRVNRAGTS